MSIKKVFLSLGSNLGNRQANLERAVASLEREPIQVTGRSSVYESEPQDLVQQPWFLNLVLMCETRCFPLQVLAMAQRIERKMGRVRAGAVRSGPRIIDIDILLFGSTMMDTPRLIIPHPRILQRRFALEPLVEIAPDMKHPTSHEPLKKSLDKISGQKLKKM